MTYLLPTDGTVDRDRSEPLATGESPPPEVSDIKIFWGPEICRLEYLLHLLDTGRVKDDTCSEGDVSSPRLSLR